MRCCLWCSPSPTLPPRPSILPTRTPPSSIWALCCPVICSGWSTRPSVQWHPPPLQLSSFVFSPCMGLCFLCDVQCQHEYMLLRFGIVTSSISDLSGQVTSHPKNCLVVLHHPSAMEKPIGICVTPTHVKCKSDKKSWNWFRARYIFCCPMSFFLTRGKVDTVTNLSPRICWQDFS